MKEMTLEFSRIAQEAGFEPEDGGKFNLPATQRTADALAAAASRLVGEWQPGDEPVAVNMTGPGPVWGYLVIAHALHGRVSSMTYWSPNATITVFSHGL
jgi:hypothetical protein